MRSLPAVRAELLRCEPEPVLFEHMPAASEMRVPFDVLGFSEPAESLWLQAELMTWRPGRDAHQGSATAASEAADTAAMEPRAVLQHVIRSTMSAATCKEVSCATLVEISSKFLARATGPCSALHLRLCVLLLPERHDRSTLDPCWARFEANIAIRAPQRGVCAPFPLPTAARGRAAPYRRRWRHHRRQQAAERAQRAAGARAQE